MLSLLALSIALSFAVSGIYLGDAFHIFNRNAPLLPRLSKKVENFVFGPCSGIPSSVCSVISSDFMVTKNILILEADFCFKKEGICDRKDRR